MIGFSLVVPCYNDAVRLRQSVERLCETMNATGLSWEFVFVEDHSRDETAAELRHCVEWLQSRGIEVSATYLDRNHGHGGAISSGIRAARGDIVGYIELDLLLAQGLVPMIEQVRRGDAEFVVGRRVFRNPLTAPFRFLSYWTYRQYTSACLRLPVADPECRLKVFRRTRVLPLLDAVKDQHCFWDTELLDRGRKAGLAIAEWPIVFAAGGREKGGPLLRAARAYRRAMKNYRVAIAVEGGSRP